MKNKQQIIKKLNAFFKSYKMINELCNKSSNDVNLVIANINRIIKYAFITPDFLYVDDLIYKCLHSQDNIDQIYIENLNKRKFLKLIKKLRTKTEFPSYIDKDILLNDIEGLLLPTENRLEEICNNNLSQLKIREEKNKQKDIFYKQQRIFEETAFTYTKKELITIDSSFIYYHPDLSGNLSEDFFNLYNDERYSKLSEHENPLRKNITENIEKIKKQNNISLVKKGNVYEISNGRHRILYLLKNKEKVEIPVSITKRIEDREFNIILLYLKSNYGVHIIKNSICNDEPDILLIHNMNVYRINGKNNLKIFANNLINNVDNSVFYITEFKQESDISNTELIYKYEQLILKKIKIYGLEILTKNYTDIIKYFEGINYYVLYNVFISMQLNYQKSILFGYDFENQYNNSNINEEELEEFFNIRKK